MAEHAAIARYHDHLQTLYRAKTETLGKTLVLLSGGSLVLSVTFLEKVTAGRPTHTWMLLVAWGSFILALACTLCSHHFSAEAVFSAMNSYPWRDTGSQQLGGRASTLVARLNPTAVVAVVVGLAFLFGFAWLNLRGG